jgi:hypothetical protein
MHADERLRALLAATGCTVCGGPLETSRIRILAERDDLAFAELPCRSCGSATLAMITGARSAEPRIDVSGPGELTAADEARSAGRPPVDEHDVRAMHELLRAHRGDLRSLLVRGVSDEADGTSSVEP